MPSPRVDAQAKKLLERAGVDGRTPRGYSRKHALLVQLAEEWRLDELANLTDHDLQSLLGPGRHSISEVKKQALRKLRPPATGETQRQHTVEESARHLLERCGISEGKYRKSYPRRLKQLLFIGSIYGLSALEKATDKQIWDLFGLGWLTERQRETEIINFILAAKTAQKRSKAKSSPLRAKQAGTSTTRRQTDTKGGGVDRAKTSASARSARSSQSKYGWQREAADAWQKNGLRGVIEAATGSGKTRVGMHIAQNLLADGWQVLIVTQSRDLVAQWVKEAEYLNMPINTDRTAWEMVNSGTRGIGVVTYARAGLGKLAFHGKQRSDPPRLLIADEAHHLGSEIQGNRILSMPWKALLGLTATLERGDDGVAKINEIVGPVVFRYSVKRAVSDGVLAPFHYVTLGVALEPDTWEAYQECDRLVKKWAGHLLAETNNQDLPNSLMKFAQQRSKAGSFAAGMYISKWNQRKKLVASSEAKTSALKNLHLEKSGSRLLVFAETEDAAIATANALNKPNIFKVKAFSSKLLNRKEREQLLDQFAAREIDGLVAPKLLDEGINLPEADLGIVLAKSSSSVQLVQRLGRVLRKKGDGRNAVFLTLFARGTYEDPHSGMGDEEKDARIAEVESASLGGRALKLSDTPHDLRALQALIQSTSAIRAPKRHQRS